MGWWKSHQAVVRDNDYDDYDDYDGYDDYDSHYHTMLVDYDDYFGYPTMFFLDCMIIYDNYVFYLQCDFRACFLQEFQISKSISQVPKSSK